MMPETKEEYLEDLGLTEAQYERYCDLRIKPMYEWPSDLYDDCSGFLNFMVAEWIREQDE